MRYEIENFHCGDTLKEALSEKTSEIQDVVAAIAWAPEFRYSQNDIMYENQAAYNRAFASEFANRGWESQPLLREQPKLIGDFRKELVFVEIQFGNSSALYRDYYKFQYGLAHGLLSLAVLVVPMEPKKFFPTRPRSVQNMADYGLAHSCLSVLPINVPTLLVGLIPDN